MVGEDCINGKYIKKNKEMFKDDTSFEIYIWLTPKK